MALATESEDLIVQLLSLALREDMGDSDITTESIVPKNLILSGHISSKVDGRIAGLNVIELFFKKFYGSVQLMFFAEDGDRVSKGQVILKMNGPGRVLLSTERLVLNILQRMSGIATQTERYVERIRGTKATLLDTRKTAPGLRALDKQAVKLGGGTNHRQGLFDSFLIKENHIAAAGSMAEAVRRAQKNNTANRMIEVEVRSHRELKEALGLGVDRILLDNMSIEEMMAAVKIAAGRIPLEASGNITLDNVRQVAETGVDFISVGSLTHSVQALDLSFIIDQSE